MITIHVNGNSFYSFHLHYFNFFWFGRDKKIKILVSDLRSALEMN